MGFELNPKNKDVKSLAVGWMSWSIFLQESGAGYVLGYGTGLKPGSYVYNNGNNGSPVSNDGYKVSAKESKTMASVMRGFVSVQRFVNKEFEALPDEEKKAIENSENNVNYKSYYRSRWHEDRMKEMEKIADFMEKSGGFTIH
jgi:nucleoside-specific outer membrane channel protein Tsx